MKYKEILKAVQKEISEDKIDQAKAILKERLLEIEDTERALATLKAQLTDLLAKAI